MHFSVLVVASALAHTSLGTPASAAHNLHEKREYLPHAWVKREELNGNLKLPVRIGMKQSNLDLGDQLLMDVSVNIEYR